MTTRIAAAALAGVLAGAAAVPADAGPRFCGLKGRVRVVDSPALADYRVRWVPEHQAQLRVRWVVGAQMRAGEWELVDEFADFTIVAEDSDHLADFRAGVTDGVPGCP